MNCAACFLCLRPRRTDSVCGFAACLADSALERRQRHPLEAVRRLLDHLLAQRAPSRAASRTCRRRSRAGCRRRSCPSDVGRDRLVGVDHGVDPLRHLLLRVADLHLGLAAVGVEELAVEVQRQVQHPVGRATSAPRPTPYCAAGLVSFCALAWNSSQVQRVGRRHRDAGRRRAASCWRRRPATPAGTARRRPCRRR